MWVFKGTRTIVVPKSEAESRTKHLSFHIEKRERDRREWQFGKTKKITRYEDFVAVKYNVFFVFYIFKIQKL